MITLDTHIRHWWIIQIPGQASTKTLDLIEETNEGRVGDFMY